jgi:hypothetical protein
MFSIFVLENLADYEIMWRNVREAERPHMKIKCVGKKDAIFLPDN